MIECETGELLNYSRLMKTLKYRYVWGIYFENKMDRLYQVMKGRVKYTNTMFFITKEEAPQNWFKDITYERVVWYMREGKDDKNQTKLMIGGYKIKYPGYYGTPMAGLLTVNSYPSGAYYYV